MMTGIDGRRNASLKKAGRGSLTVKSTGDQQRVNHHPEATKVEMKEIQAKMR